jgi:hypothetical protein
VRALIAIATEDERPFVEDGFVDRKERDDAFAAMVLCLEDAGLTVLEYAFKDDGPGYSITYQSMDGDKENLAPVVEAECRSRHFRTVEQVYFLTGFLEERR